MSESVLVERRGAVLVVTLNRPQARNAVDADMAQALAAAMDRLDGEAGVSVGVITGAGGVFCAGMDLKAFARDGRRPHVPGRGFAGVCERPPTKPLVAAVEGYALAGGFEVALSCDLIVAADDARFGLPEVKRGIVPAAGGLLRLPQRIPHHLAMELILTGEMLGAARAQACGLVNRLVAPGRALDEALALAEAVAANGPLALAVAKQVVRESRDWPVDEQFARQRELVDPVFASEDAREGARAFTEKRAPVWRGC